jgi:hypothetical protein
MRKRKKSPFESKQYQPDEVSDVLNLRCVRQAPNPRWVICDMNGQQVKVSISPRYTNKLVGKRINVAKVSRGLIEEYEHLP